MECAVIGFVQRTALGVLAAFALAGVIAFTAVETFKGVSAIRGGAPQAAPSGTEDEYRALAQRLLAPPFPNPDGSLSTLTLYPAALPPSQAEPIPVPPGAKLIGSTVRTRGSSTSVSAVLDMPGAASAVTDFYTRELAAKGFSPSASRPGGTGGGFVSTIGPANTLMFCKSTTGPTFNVTVWTRPGSPNDVRVNYEPPNPQQSGGYGPCNPPPAGGPGAGMDRLPRLQPPDGVVLQQSGGSGGGNRQASEATATTTRSPRDLEAHFAQQLAAAGWTKTGSGADTTLAWSTWKVPGDGAWQGTLIVYEAPGKDRRGLLLRAEGQFGF